MLPFIAEMRPRRDAGTSDSETIIVISQDVTQTLKYTLYSCTDHSSTIRCIFTLITSWRVNVIINYMLTAYNFTHIGPKYSTLLRAYVGIGHET